MDVISASRKLVAQGDTNGTHVGTASHTVWHRKDNQSLQVCSVAAQFTALTDILACFRQECFCMQVVSSDRHPMHV